jgi:hypothetical protein
MLGGMKMPTPIARVIIMLQWMMSMAHFGRRVYHRVAGVGAVAVCRRIAPAHCASVGLLLLFARLPDLVGVDHGSRHLRGDLRVALTHTVRRRRVVFPQLFATDVFPGQTIRKSHSNEQSAAQFRRLACVAARVSKGSHRQAELSNCGLSFHSCHCPRR